MGDFLHQFTKYQVLSSLCHLTARDHWVISNEGGAWAPSNKAQKPLVGTQVLQKFGLRVKFFAPIWLEKRGISARIG